MHLQEQLSPPAINEGVNVMDAESVSASSIRSVFRIPVSVVDLLSNYTVSGVLLSFTPGEVAVSVNEPMSEQREVAVYLNSFSFEGHTLYCRPSETLYETHISIDDIQGAGLRKTPRFPVMIPAELLAAGCDPAAITILDLSRDGMGIQSPIPMNAGQPIAIVSGPAFVFAIVRHCQRMPDGLFHAGVEMHHLFEKPPHAPVESQQSSFPGKFFAKWKTRLLSARAPSRNGSRSQVRQLGGHSNGALVQGPLPWRSGIT
jgi:PilZ domain